MDHSAPRGMATLLKIASRFSSAVVSSTHELLLANSQSPNTSVEVDRVQSEVPGRAMSANRVHGFERFNLQNTSG
jgi:hypothetical protein